MLLSLYDKINLNNNLIPVSILVVMDVALAVDQIFPQTRIEVVSILVVMDVALAVAAKATDRATLDSLNPCCNGCCSRCNMGTP